MVKRISMQARLRVAMLEGPLHAYSAAEKLGVDYKTARDTIAQVTRLRECVRVGKFARPGRTARWGGGPPFTGIYGLTGVGTERAERERAEVEQAARESARAAPIDSTVIFAEGHQDSDDAPLEEGFSPLG